MAVLQVKNRLEPKYDASKSAGHRNVALSLVVCDWHTMPPGAEHQICELQVLGCSTRVVLGCSTRVQY